MALDSILFIIGSQPITLFDALIAAGALALLLLLVMLIMIWRGHRQRKSDALEGARRTTEMEMRLAELSGSLRSFADHSQGSQAQLSRTLDERLDQVSHRIGAGLNDQSQRTAQSLQNLHERLAVIDTAQKNLTALSSEMISLKDILSNKQTRGAFGQGRMEAIIRDGLPGNAFEFQGTLSNGKRPDCLIKLPDSVLRIVIDAKFPLEAFNALKDAKAEPDVRAAEARLRADVLKHVKDIAEKYLLPGETHETAIMFVPSESIHADLHERFEDVIQKSHRQRVILASPSILMLLVQTLQAIFKDAAMREQAHIIKVEVARLLEDVSRVKERVGDLQRHFGLANADLEKLSVSADKVTKRGLRIESMDLSETEQAQAKPRLVSG
ncbi:MAG: DNA recombination protein RmuC [Rhizobiales bacterium]|nr:DNA recombination protein RmuC [Hyphomicrobiales bacterium]